MTPPKRNGADWLQARKVRPVTSWRDIFGRVWWNLWRLPLPFRWLDVNPYVLNGQGDLRPKSRHPWEDIWHSVEDIYREGVRHFERPDKAGIPD